MTNPDYTHIAVVLDRSGSMERIKEDMEGGLNAFFEQQAELPGKCLVDFIQFDNRYEVVYKGKPVSKAKVVLEPRGSTALLDAIGRTVVGFGAKLRKMREADRPGTVIVVVVTDGQENASKEWTADAVRELVNNQTDKYNWNFTFIGANMDAVRTGADYGFRPDYSLTFDTKNVGAMTESLNSYTVATRSGLANAYTDEDRKAANAGSANQR